MTTSTNILFSEWFDINNPDHLQAYEYLMQNGYWPEGFIPDHVKIDFEWQFKIVIRMAKAWRDHIFGAIDTNIDLKNLRETPVENAIVFDQQPDVGTTYIDTSRPIQLDMDENQTPVFLIPTVDEQGGKDTATESIFAFNVKHPIIKGKMRVELGSHIAPGEATRLIENMVQVKKEIDIS